jgi:hypothetical protein
VSGAYWALWQVVGVRPTAPVVCQCDSGTAQASRGAWCDSGHSVCIAPSFEWEVCHRPSARVVRRPSKLAEGTALVAMAAVVDVATPLLDCTIARPAGRLVKHSRDALFNQAHSGCELSCCRLVERFSVDNPKRGDDGRQIVGTELRQMQFKEQRAELSAFIKHSRPIPAGEEKSFGGCDQVAIDYAGSSVAKQILHQIDYAGFVGASKQQLDELRTRVSYVCYRMRLRWK